MLHPAEVDRVEFWRTTGAYDPWNAEPDCSRICGCSLHRVVTGHYWRLLECFVELIELKDIRFRISHL
jgi:hypothetical protein